VAIDQGTDLLVGGKRQPRDTGGLRWEIDSLAHRKVRFYLVCRAMKERSIEELRVELPRKGRSWGEEHIT